MYSIAAAYFEPASIQAFEIDPDAIAIAQENLEHYEIEENQCKIHNLDILKEFSEENNSQFLGQFDTVLMNPPFGTKNNEGVDMQLLKAGTRALKPGG